MKYFFDGISQFANLVYFQIYNLVDVTWQCASVSEMATENCDILAEM